MPYIYAKIYPKVLLQYEKIRLLIVLLNLLMSIFCLCILNCLD